MLRSKERETTGRRCRLAVKRGSPRHLTFQPLLSSNSASLCCLRLAAFATSLACRRRRASSPFSPIPLPSHISPLAARHGRRAAKDPRASAGSQSLRRTAGKDLSTSWIRPRLASSSPPADAKPCLSAQGAGGPFNLCGGAPTSIREARVHLQELGTRSVSAAGVCPADIVVIIGRAHRQSPPTIDRPAGAPGSIMVWSFWSWIKQPAGRA
jgi:hypothetical protein